MCLAVPAQIVACEGDEAVVDLLGNRLTINRIMTPQADVGSWVLVHAGFSITELDEEAARETWDYLQAALGDDAALAEAAGSDAADSASAPAADAQGGAP